MLSIRHAAALVAVPPSTTATVGKKGSHIATGAEDEGIVSDDRFGAGIGVQRKESDDVAVLISGGNLTVDPDVAEDIALYSRLMRQVFQAVSGVGRSVEHIADRDQFPNAALQVEHVPVRVRSENVTRQFQVS